MPETYDVTGNMPGTLRSYTGQRKGRSKANLGLSAQSEQYCSIRKPKRAFATPLMSEIRSNNLVAARSLRYNSRLPADRLRLRVARMDIGAGEFSETPETRWTITAK